ncbi:hypothetical protein ACNKHW_17090 [Shigella flexneri]
MPRSALAGGDLAAKQPSRTCWRSACALCRSGRIIPKTASLQQQNWSVLAPAIERGINAPLASSCGRFSMQWRRHWAVRQPR